LRFCSLSIHKESNMSTRRVVWSLGIALCVAGLAWADNTEQVADYKAQAETLLAKADFDGALEAYGKAAKADTGNTECREAYAVLRRVIKMREAVAKETNPERLAAVSSALRAFYYEREVYSEALALDQKTFEREKSADSAAALAQSQLQMGQTAEAEATIAQIAADQMTPDLLLLKAIAVARQGRTDEAKAVLADFKAPENSSPALFYNLACAHAQAGDAEAALKWLVQAFENIPPSRLDMFKSRASADKDLASLTDNPGFALALKTESKVKESSCSGGTSCGSCPSRTKCGSGTSTASGGDKK